MLNRVDSPRGAPSPPGFLQPPPEHGSPPLFFGTRYRRIGKEFFKLLQMIAGGRVNDQRLIAIRGLNISNAESVAFQPFTHLGVTEIDIERVAL